MEDKIVEYKKESSWFGLSTKVTGSPYHDVDIEMRFFIMERSVWVATLIRRIV